MLECELIKLYHFMGKKWSMALLHNINEKPLSFNELKKLTNNLISPILLSNRLKEMIKLKLIKKITRENKLCYVRTEPGKEFDKIIHDLKKWSIKHNYDLPKECKKNICICKNIFDKRSKNDQAYSNKDSYKK